MTTQDNKSFLFFLHWYLRFFFFLFLSHFLHLATFRKEGFNWLSGWERGPYEGGWRSGHRRVAEEREKKKKKGEEWTETNFRQWPVHVIYKLLPSVPADCLQVNELPSGQGTRQTHFPLKEEKKRLKAVVIGDHWPSSLSLFFFLAHNSKEIASLSKLRERKAWMNQGSTGTQILFPKAPSPAKHQLHQQITYAQTVWESP